VQLCLPQSPWWQLHQVLGHPNLAPVKLQQLYGHQAAQAAVEKEQVEVEVPVADGHALLAGDKGEVRAQLQQEPLALQHLLEMLLRRLDVAASTGEGEAVRGLRVLGIDLVGLLPGSREPVGCHPLGH